MMEKYDYDENYVQVAMFKSISLFDSRICFFSLPIINEKD